MARSKLSPKVLKFILEKLTEGISINKCCKLYPKEVNNVKPNAVYMKSIRDADFAEQLDRAYTAYYMFRMAELDEISDINWITTRLDTEFNGDSKLAMEARRAKMDAIKFDLSNLAPKMAKRFDKAQKVEVEGANLGPQIVIMDYSSPEKTLEKQVNNLIEGNSKDD